MIFLSDIAVELVEFMAMYKNVGNKLGYQCTWINKVINFKYSLAIQLYFEANFSIAYLNQK